MNKLLEFLAKLAFGKHIVAGLAYVHDKADGKKSEILTGLLLLVYALELAGVINKEQGTAIETLLSGGAIVAVVARAKKIKDLVESAAK